MEEVAITTRVVSMLLDPTVITSAIGLVTAIVLYFSYRLRFKPKKFADDDSIAEHTTPLTRHYVFKVLKDYRRILTTGFDLDGPVRTAAFQEFIITFIDIAGNHLYSLASKLDESCLKTKCTGNCPINSLDLYNWNREVYENIMREASSFYRKNPGEYTDEEIIILDYVKALFNTHCTLGFDFIRISIDCIVTNSKYTTCTKHLQANILSSYQSVFRNLLVGTVEHFRRTNGFFNDKTIEFRNKPYPSWYKD